MKKIIIVLGVVVLCQTAAFGQSDVFIDLNGNMETGVTNPSGRLEVQGDTDRDAVVGITDGTGKGVYGENEDSSGYAGYFLGNARVTGDLTVDGTLTSPFSETDPQVGVLSSGEWCVSDGSQVNCIQSAPVTSETDPQVGVLSSGEWCVSDGSQVNCIQSAPVTSETDPQVGTNTTNYIPKWDGSELVTGSIYDNGKVGIGTNTPSYKLDVRGGTTDYVGYFLNDNNSIGDDAYGIYVIGNAYDTGGGWGLGASFFGIGGSASGVAYGIQSYADANGSSNAYGVYSIAINGTTTGREYAFYGEGDGYFSGDVGIGIDDPLYKLHVEGNIFVNGTDGFNASGEDAIVYFGHLGHNIRGEYGTGVVISAYNAADALTVRENSGNVGIGTTSPSQRLYVVGNIHATGSITSGSSRELKENIRDLSAEEAIIALHSLYPQKFYYKADREDEHVGFIAEDVPELVATKDRKGVSSMDVVAVLTKVVQEQQKTIAELKKQNNQISQRMNALEQEIKLNNSMAMNDLQ